MKKILDVFASYTDAYLEWRNEFLLIETFCDFYELDEDEVNLMLDVSHKAFEENKNLPINSLDYFMNRAINKNNYKFE